MLAAEHRRLSELLAPAQTLPPHLAGIPSCLHKYEPLFRERADGAPQAQPESSAL